MHGYKKTDRHFYPAEPIWGGLSQFFGRGAFEIESNAASPPGHGAGPEPGDEVIIKDKDKIKTAVKCDMCHDLKGGPACVRACPTGAAIRVSPQDFIERVQND